LRKDTSTVYLDSQNSVRWAVVCNDSGTGYNEESWVLDLENSAGLYPLFGDLMTLLPEMQNACLYWGGPVVARPPIESIASAGGILMLQSQYDPQTPREGAMKTFLALPNASMIQVDGEYSHGLYPPYGSACVDVPVAEYFLTGKQPSRMSNCEGNALCADQ